MFRCIAYVKKKKKQKKREKKITLLCSCFILGIYVWLSSMLAIFKHEKVFIIVYVQSGERRLGKNLLVMSSRTGYRRYFMNNNRQ